MSPRAQRRDRESELLGNLALCQRRRAACWIHRALRVAPVGAAILEGLSRFGTNIVQPRPDLIALRTESDAAIPAIVSWLVQQGVQIHAVQPRRKSLEDVFLDVMGEDERPG